MTSPRAADFVLVSPGELAGLADELAGLASELSEDAGRCRTAAAGLSTALDGEVGWTAGAAGSAWAGLEEVLAGRTSALALTVAGAVQSYLDEDARTAGWMGRRRELPR
jgi:hypothetical protein